MLSIAKSKVPAGLEGNIETVNQDFMEAKFAPHSFDLILCIGVMAHVASPADCIQKMVSLLKPDGSLILECSDATHFVTRFLAHVYKIKGLFKGLFKAKPQTYPLKRSYVFRDCGDVGAPPTASQVHIPLQRASGRSASDFLPSDSVQNQQRPFRHTENQPKQLAWQ